MYEATARSIHEVLDYQKGRVHELVEDFTSAKRLQRAVVEREKTDGVIKAVVATSLLVVSSVLSAGSAAAAVGVAAGTVTAAAGTALTVSANSANLISSMYIGYSGFAKSLIDGLPHEIRNNK